MLRFRSIHEAKCHGARLHWPLCSLFLAIAVLALAGCAADVPGATAYAADGDAAEFAFANAVEDPPADWDGPVFQLSHDYPTENPGTCPPDVCTWLAMDVDFKIGLDADAPTWDDPAWNEYIAAVLDYIREGQDPQLANDVGFQVDVDGETRWFHVPWMAYDLTTGREFVHGTTNERTSHLADLLGNGNEFGVHTLPAVTDECKEKYATGFETWAVGVYNTWGGWSLGQAWPESGTPQVSEYMGSPMPAGLPFPEGTVVAKFLFTNAPTECVPYLEGSPEWQIHRHKTSDTTGKYVCEREVQTSRLVQVDIAVVDEDSPTRWVYGTFGFNGNIEADNIWDKLAPVGLQWGSDPWTFPAVPRTESIPPRQSVLNTGIGIYEHFGCEGRLAGPVDNPQSSCMSCHASAFAPQGGAQAKMGVNTPATFGFPGLCTNYSQDNVDYFQNSVAPQGYYGGEFPNAMSLDTSLQMWVAFEQYGFFNTNGAPNPCEAGE